LKRIEQLLKAYDAGAERAGNAVDVIGTLPPDLALKPDTTLSLVSK
jgi:hypothetical protein